MPVEKTELLYETSKAEKSLKKLDRQVVKSGKTAEKSFGGEAAGGVKKFGDLAGRAAPKISAAVNSVKGLASSGGLIAGGFAIAGAAIVSTIANVVDLAGQLADIDARLDVINKTAERTLKFRDLASSIGDADVNRGFVEQRRALKVEQAQNSLRQNQVERARDLSKELLDIKRREFSQIDSAFKASIRERETAEQRLKNKLSEGDIVGSEFSNRTQGQQVDDLTSKASREARKGNVEAAEALINKAKELSEELGNHVFFTDKIARANKAVVKALQEDVNQAKTKEGQLSQERKQLQGRVEDSQGFVDALNQELKTILQQNRALAAQRKLIGENALLAKDQQTREEGERRVSTGVGQVSEIAGSIGGQAVLGKIRDQLGQLVTTVKEGGGRLSGVQEGRDSIDLIASTLAKNLDKAFADGSISPSEAQSVAEGTANISKALAVLEKDLADQSLSAVLEPEVARLKSLLQGLTNIGTGAEQFRSGGGGFNQGITPSNAVSGQTTKTEIKQDINVQIEGGMIDSKTIGEIVEQVRRELRKETSRGTGG